MADKLRSGIPRGEVTLLFGTPGEGKTIITQSLASAVAADPSGRHVLMANVDDNPGEVAARIRAAGTPLPQTCRLWAQFAPASVRTLRELHAEWRIDLLVLDPLVLFPMKLRELHAFAAETGAAVLGTAYPLKDGKVPQKLFTIRTKINVDSGTLRRQDGETIDFKIVDAVTPSGATTAKVEWL